MKKKEKPKLTIKEIKELQPLAEVYELNEFRRYIIVVKKSSLIGLDPSRSHQAARELARIIISAGISCNLIAGIDDDVKFYETCKCGSGVK